MKLEQANDIKALRKQFDSIKSSVAGDTRFGAQAILFLAERLVSIEALLSKSATDKYLRQSRKKRPPSEWQKFFAAGMKAGKTATEIGAEWRAKKS